MKSEWPSELFTQRPTSTEGEISSFMMHENEVDFVLFTLFNSKVIQKTFIMFM